MKEFRARVSRRGRIVAVLLLTLLFPACRREPPPQDLSARLAAALEAGRWIEPRLAGAAAHAPCSPAGCPAGRLLCEPACSPRTSEPARHLFSASVSGSSERPGTAAAERHAAAVLGLIAEPDATAAETTTAMLRELTRDHPADPGLWNDLAAAEVVLAQRSDRPSALGDALVHAQRALDLAPAMPEARFNRALASSLLALAPDAEAAWRAVLEVEGEGSPWSEEARRRLRSLRAADPAGSWRRARNAVTLAAERGDAARVRQLVGPFRAAARRWLEEEALLDWAVAWQAGRPEEADRILGRTRLVAAQLAALERDPMLADAVAAIDRSRGPVRDALAAGHRLYAEAQRAALGARQEAVLRDHGRAADALERGGSPFRSWAEVGRAVSLYQLHRLPEALEVLAREREVAERGRYVALQARILWIQALCELYSSLPPMARGSYRAAAERYREIGERENLANVEVRLAEVYSALGQEELAWRHRYQALSDLPHVVGSQARTYLLVSAAYSLLELGAPSAAQRLQAEAVAVARTPPNPPAVLAVALRAYAETSLHLDDRSRARAVLDEAFRLTSRVPEPIGSAIRARIRAVEGSLLLADSPARAAEAFGEALDLLPAAEYRGYRARLHLDRAAAHQAAAAAEAAGGRPDAAAAMERRATADLASSLAEVDAEWEQVLARRERGEDEELWSSYFGAPQDTFDRLIAALADAGRYAEAFEYAERSRARDLLGLAAGRTVPLAPRSADDVARALPAGTVLIEYAVLEDRLLTWTFRRGRFSAESGAVPRAALERAVGAFQRAAGELRAEPAARRFAELHPVLVPASLRLRRGERLVFVPDGVLHGLPFAALRDPGRGRWLVEDHPIATAPSATLYLHALERDRALGEVDPPSALFIGDPAFDPRRFLGLDRLPDALAEARQAAEVYPGAILLSGAEATREAFLRLIGHRDVVHFAGHAVILPQAALGAMLVLAPSPDGTDGGELYARDLLRQELPRTRLVVLSACSTAGGQPVGALGVAPLVRPFLGAGVPAVVGSLWDVDDPAAAALLTDFHRRLRRGDDAATALQRAQLALLGSGNLLLSSPRSWAAFQVVGTASFPRSRKE
jgi:tetratricopeptide (TPR) repeat protein